MEGLHYLLMKANANLNRRIMGEAATLGLSPGQPKVLECLMELGESNQKTIAAFCEIYGLGTVGWFFAANEIGSIIAILTPFTIINIQNLLK